MQKYNPICERDDETHRPTMPMSPLRRRRQLLCHLAVDCDAEGAVVPLGTNIVPSGDACPSALASGARYAPLRLLCGRTGQCAGVVAPTRTGSTHREGRGTVQLEGKGNVGRRVYIRIPWVASCHRWRSLPKRTRGRQLGPSHANTDSW